MGMVLVMDNPMKMDENWGCPHELGNLYVVCWLKMWQTTPKVAFLAGKIMIKMVLTRIGTANPIFEIFRWDCSFFFYGTMINLHNIYIYIL